jgi:hypothetical protein
MLLAAFAATPLQPTSLPDGPAGAAPVACPADPPPVSATGDWPPDLRWPEPFVTEGAVATLRARRVDGVVEVWSTPPDPVVWACLRDAVRDLRAARLGALGLAPDPDALLALANTAPPAPETPLPPVSWPGIWLGAGDRKSVV